MSIPEPRPASPWHPGEIAIQAHLGVADRMSELGPRVIRDHLTEQHRAFYRHLPFVVLGAVDPAGDAWATLRAGPPGFLDAPDPFHLHARIGADSDDPAEAGLSDGAGLGLLGIDLTTRRRNRLNGTIRQRGADGFDIAVAQSFGNCPQYIRVRPNPGPIADTGATDRHVSYGLDDSARTLVTRADTLFVASSVAGPEGFQVDVSHRGGPAGFVRIDADGGLTIPDYSGNRFFNTLGNLLANPRAGLAFPDFQTGDLLQMTGRAEVILDSPEVAAFPGAERLWRFEPRTVIRRGHATARSR